MLNDLSFLRLIEWLWSKTLEKTASNACNADSDFETYIFMQEAEHDQIKKYISSLTDQLEYLTRLIKGMTEAHSEKISPDGDW